MLDPQGQNLKLLLLLSMLLMSLSILRMTCKAFLRLFWRLELPFLLPLLLQLLPSPSCLRINWKPLFWTYNAESLTWTVTTSVSNVRTTLLLLELRDLSKFLLPRSSSRTKSVSVSSNTSGNKTQTALSWSHGTSSRRSFTATWVTYKLLWTPTGERLRRTPTTS